MEVLVIFLVGVIVAFFIFRAVMLWYWKVDEQVALAKEQNGLLRDVRDTLRQMAGAAPASSVSAQSSSPVIETSPGGNKLRCPTCQRFVRAIDADRGRVCPDDGTVIVPEVGPSPATPDTGEATDRYVPRQRWQD